MTPQLDTDALENKVKQMYQAVANDPYGDFHFEMGRALAERLGYPVEDLDRVPAGAIDSFAGVGYHIDLANLHDGQQVVDLGSGSGLDTFVAALAVGRSGDVVGIDMTDAQRDKAERLRREASFQSVRYVDAYIENVPLPDASVDAIISNGVINLAADKEAVFREAARLLVPGGRLAISDIVTDRELPEGVVCNVDLWAACIGGAMQYHGYERAIEHAGLRIEQVRPNPQYHFLSGRATGAATRFGARSVSIAAVKA